MSNIDKQTLRDIATAAVSTPLWHAVGVFGEIVDPADEEWKPVHDFCKTFTAERVLALLGELEAKDKRIDEQMEVMRQAACDISYAIFNLTGSDLSRLQPGVVETTDPTDTALIAERSLRAAAAAKGE
ncbi:ead/Ea22-like family protein [Enterobacter hormaechei]